jgi:hypothetical protein
MIDTGIERRELSNFHNLHQGETIIVCGCGESLNELTQPERFITIGVNDVGRRFTPNYLVVVNPPNQFSGDRFSYVESSQAEYLFTQLNLGLSRQNIIKFQLGAYGGTDFSNPDVLHHTQNSPYVALCLAVQMGATRIGLIGVDFTDHHFFAPTGMHSLSPQLSTIDQQYQRLGEAIKARGIEVFNLSSRSRLTAFPKMSVANFVGLEADAASLPVTANGAAKEQLRERRIFFVNYKFLSCGEVFTDGLRHAAESLGVSYGQAYWDDARLHAKVQEFKPDLLFVVHGRRFVQRWRKSFPSVKKAVWLLDEPYEVDDTTQWSNAFDVVYLNDPSTLEYHRNAHYLPVAYDSAVHRENGDAREYQVGFIGGHNQTRERYLLALLEAGLLSYVVGGPWDSPKLRRVCLARNIPASETAELYRQTKVVVNLFRDIHHFNRRGIQAYSMNPRIYEALACGSVVVSEARPELPVVFPELPTFSDASQLLKAVGELLNQDEAYQTSKRVCRERVQTHNYRERLLRVFETLDWPTGERPVHKNLPVEVAMKTAQPCEQCSSLSLDGWELCGQAVQTSDGDSILLSKANDEGPGTEQGLASLESYQSVELSFEVNIAPDACFVAKLFQASAFDQKTNSYHLFCQPGHTYLARQNRVFKSVKVNRDKWQRIRLKCCDKRIQLDIDGVLSASVVDGMLERGYCFLGVRRGKALLRNLKIRPLTRADRDSYQTRELEITPGTGDLPAYQILHETERTAVPTVSIVTTVYDRVNCLADCIRSVNQLSYGDIEHIIVSDHPPGSVVDAILALVGKEAGGSATYANLNARFNNWGIAPASVGLHLARGRYVCFFSDDNGYTPDHFGPLVAALDQDKEIGFAYSSCQYAGRRVLRNARPLPGGIDLGQPLFRRELFNRYLGGPLPFDMMAWDWHMIDAFMRQGVKWRHIDRPSFLFRLAACRKWVQA